MIWYLSDLCSFFPNDLVSCPRFFPFLSFYSEIPSKYLLTHLMKVITPTLAMFPSNSFQVSVNNNFSRSDNFPGISFWGNDDRRFDLDDPMSREPLERNKREDLNRALSALWTLSKKKTGRKKFTKMLLKLFLRSSACVLRFVLKI